MSQPTRRRRSMTEQAAQAAVDQACRSLRLPTIRTQVEEITAAAQREQLTYWGFLAELLRHRGGGRRGSDEIGRG
jgi:hypothetical protein